MRCMGRGKRSVVYLIVGALVAGMLTGCGGDDIGGTNLDSSGVNNTVSNEEDGQRTAMGRYVEQDVSLNGNSLSDWNSRVFRQEDGSLLLAVNSGFVMRSWDNGGSWIGEQIPWLTQLVREGNYILSMAFGPDQTAAVIYTMSLEENTSENIKLLLVKPDNTEIPVDIELTEEDGWLTAVYISDMGRIIVSTLSSNLYEVKGDGSSEKFLTVEEGQPELLQFHGNLMLMDSVGYDMPLIYDMEAKEYIEDDVLADFVKENFSGRDSYVGKSYDMFLLAEGDDVIYLAGQKGVYRHVLGGSAMEQVIDGNLSIFGNPVYTIMDMAVVHGDEFLVLFTGGKVVRFVYNPDIPTIPDDTLKVYSLKDKATIRQAINLYQTANPSIYVDYEVGLGQGRSITKEDAIKNLNTRIMAGEGPDVLILDDLPIDSYVEKGLLMDIAPILNGMGEKEAVLPNVVEAFREDAHVYTIPCEIQLPYILGRNSDLEKMTDLSGIAGAMEDIRKDNPEDDLLRISSQRGIMRIFSMASTPAWKTESGTVDKEAVSDFLEQTKRIYEAQMDGLSEEAVMQWEVRSAIYEGDYGAAFEDSDVVRMNRGEIYFKGDMCKFVAGSMKDIDEYTLQVSLDMPDTFGECKSIPMAGQCDSVFWARTLMGINALSENTTLAQDFLKVVLGGEVQTNVIDGIPVNKQAILDNYADQRRRYKDNDYISGSSCLTNEEGIEVDITIRVPGEEQVDELIKWIESMDTAYVENTTFENVVYEEGIAYMKGNKSLTDAVDSIEKRLAIYLAE